MDRLLKVGDRFRFAEMKIGEGRIVPGGNGPPIVDFSRVTLASRPNNGVTCHWIERRDDLDGHGEWSRERETKIHTAAAIADSVVWEVTATSMTGGGLAHGFHDSYPDGHFVEARSFAVDMELTFFQTGCFVGLVPPEKIIEVPK